VYGGENKDTFFSSPALCQQKRMSTSYESKVTFLVSSHVGAAVVTILITPYLSADNQWYCLLEGNPQHKASRRFPQLQANHLRDLLVSHY